MKSSIKIILGKLAQLNEEQDGTLSGGFASLKGGLNFIDQNSNNCLNINCFDDCGKLTNTVGPDCSNSGVCFM